MDIFIFTYEKDACMLPQSVAAAARHGRVVLVDQADAPACAGEAEALALGAAEYVRTEWPRGGNLNGVEAVRGMLDTYMAHGTDEWVMQLDSDMLLLDGAGLLGDAHADMYGQTIGWDDDKAMRRAVQYCAGGGMLIRRTMLEPMRKLMDDEGIAARVRSGAGYSDHVLTVLCGMAGGHVVQHRYQAAQKAESGLLRRVGWYRWEEGYDLWRNSCAVHFYHKLAPGDTDAEQRAATAETMRRVLAEFDAEQAAKQEQQKGDEDL